jgi:hypothetical protein
MTVDDSKPPRSMKPLTWYSNLIMDVGRYAIHLLESKGLVELEPEDYDDCERAKRKFLDALDMLVNLK